MNEIVRRTRDSLQLSSSPDPAVDPSSYSWGSGAGTGHWGWLESMPDEVTAALRKQGLWPGDIFIGCPSGPDAVAVDASGRFRREASGWIVSPSGLVRFEAVQDAVREPGGTYKNPVLRSVGVWRVSGTMTPYSERARQATKVVPVDATPTGAVNGARSGRWVGPANLRYAETLPATARSKLLSVAHPTLADSDITRMHAIPGIYGYVVSAVAANAIELVAVEGRKYIEARSGDTDSTADARLATAPWELTILRGIFREQIDTH